MSAEVNQDELEAFLSLFVPYLAVCWFSHPSVYLKIDRSLLWARFCAELKAKDCLLEASVQGKQTWKTPFWCHQAG